MISYSATFGVLGKPAPKGSWTPYQDKRTGRIGLKPHSSKRAKDWDFAIKLAASKHAPPEPLACPVAVRLAFRLERPKSVKPADRPLPLVKPDIDKLERAVLDALTGVIWKDDAQVVELRGSKVYGAPQGVSISIRALHSEEDLGTI